jgi:hypothetical protein
MAIKIGESGFAGQLSEWGYNGGMRWFVFAWIAFLSAGTATAQVVPASPPIRLWFRTEMQLTDGTFERLRSIGGPVVRWSMLLAGGSLIDPDDARSITAPSPRCLIEFELLSPVFLEKEPEPGDRNRMILERGPVRRLEGVSYEYRIENAKTARRMTCWKGHFDKRSEEDMVLEALGSHANVLSPKWIEDEKSASPAVKSGPSVPFWRTFRLSEVPTAPAAPDRPSGGAGLSH